MHVPARNATARRYPPAPGRIAAPSPLRGSTTPAGGSRRALKPAKRGAISRGRRRCAGGRAVVRHRATPPAAEPVAVAAAREDPAAREDAAKAAAEAPELIGGDLAVVHEPGERPELAVRGKLVELVLGDHAIGEEVPDLLAVALAFSMAALRSSIAPSARPRERRDRRLLGPGDGPLGDEVVEHPGQEVVPELGLDVGARRRAGVGVGAAGAWTAGAAGLALAASTAPAAPTRSRPASGMTMVLLLIFTRCLQGAGRRLTTACVDVRQRGLRD